MENNQKTLPLVSELPQVSTPQLSKSPDKSKGTIGNLSFKFGAAMLVLLAATCKPDVDRYTEDPMYDVDINYLRPCACFEVDGTSLLPENRDTMLKWLIYGRGDVDASNESNKNEDPRRTLWDSGNDYINQYGEFHFQTTPDEITPTENSVCVEIQLLTPNIDHTGTAHAATAFALNRDGTLTVGYDRLEDCEEEKGTQSQYHAIGGGCGASY